MAQKVQVLLVDDVDGGTADETVTFGLDGVTYEIDLTSENAGKLRDALAPWVGHARRVGGRSSSGRSSSGRSSSGSSSSRAARANEAQEIREWAKENGYQVSERGRISAEVRQAYDAAH
ncbi:Lsr2 family protein [Cellulomonas sp. JZ18]|uniref:histone-like nucleoid-structuring protein Lsr2 n=1 Tax=Cellulomonas sp. JZ18 TaxID=2654191 RepID=UPI0012D40E75|nr:Lsr2 family protein [Cellulomonas sp. JZ18]QGQ20361.1 Lsr2 family protein [Cellulomonas sp. JZ18]